MTRVARACFALTLLVSTAPRTGLAQTPDAPGRHRVEIRSTADSTLQPSVLVMPAAPAPSANGRRPLAVMLHTWSFDLDQRDSTVEAEADARGWLLLSPNFRGRSETPLACGSDVAQQDILDAVAWVRAHYAVDSTRIYLLGRSGGGFMTMLMASRYPAQGAAASAWVGISDLAAWNSEHPTDEYGRMMRGCFGETPRESAAIAAAYAARAPLRYLKPKGRVPFDLADVVHDTVVSPRHTLEAFQAIAPQVLSNADIEAMMRGQYGTPVPAADTILGRTIHVRRTAGASRLTLFEGEHEWISRAAIAWLAAQQRRR
ncbi:alpha/beta hydrolase family protein [Gemmatimonas sp.]|uniref:alpha/beta hydrolase family protein n=1 Tax=Gemmatimonas sp. TaxID=1962908 RepID=UPI003567773E